MTGRFRHCSPADQLCSRVAAPDGSVKVGPDLLQHRAWPEVLQVKYLRMRMFPVSQVNML